MENATKERILQTSLKLFAQNGFEAVSVKDIADQLAITKSALYRHFENKRAIFDSIVERMAEQDEQRALEFDVPDKPLSENEQAYSKTQLEKLIEYTRAQFSYWTEDAFASRFRRMMTLEQYRSAEMNALYHSYLCAGPIGYVTDIFARILPRPADAAVEAVNFYAPIFCMYSLYDSTKEQAVIADLLDKHLESFTARIKTTK